MAVPKKKISVSRKRTRIRSTFIKKKKYTLCNKCFNYIQLHRVCSCEIEDNLTNLVIRYSE